MDPEGVKDGECVFVKSGKNLSFEGDNSLLFCFLSFML
jgi:hypothetical protein